MDKIVLKKKLFSKPTIDVPEKFLEDSNTVYIDRGENFMIISNSLKSVDANSSLIETLCDYEEGITRNNMALTFSVCDHLEMYKNVSGFYLYNNEIFFKTNGKNAGRNINTNESMSEYILNNKITIDSSIGEILVKRLILNDI